MSATRFRLCVPNEAVEKVKEGLMMLLSEAEAYGWHQRPLAALRRGVVRDTEEQDEAENAKPYPVRGFFG